MKTKSDSPTPWDDLTGTPEHPGTPVVVVYQCDNGEDFVAGDFIGFDYSQIMGGWFIGVMPVDPTQGPLWIKTNIRPAFYFRRG